MEIAFRFHAAGIYATWFDSPELVEGPTIGSNVVIKWSLVLIPGIPVSDRQEQYQRRADNHRAFDECDSHVAFN